MKSVIKLIKHHCSKCLTNCTLHNNIVYEYIFACIIEPIKMKTHSLFDLYFSKLDYIVYSEQCYVCCLIIVPWVQIQKYHIFHSIHIV